MLTMAAARGQATDAGLRDELQRLEHATAELVDEVVFREGEADKWRRCAEAFVDYAVQVEQCVVLPALGALAHATSEPARDAAVRLGAALAATSPRMARVLPLLRAAPPAALGREARERLLQAAPPAGGVEDGYVALQGLLETKDRLRVLVSEAAEAVGAAEAFGAVGAAGPPDAADAAEVHRLVGENATLRQQLESANARNDARGRLATQEESLLEGRLETTARLLAVAEKTVEEQRLQLRASESTADLYRQAQQERGLLMGRIGALEGQLGGPAPPREWPAARPADDSRPQQLEHQLAANEQTIAELRRHVVALETRAEAGAEALLPVSAEAELAQRTKLKAFEMTVGALNEELAELERRAIAADDNHRAELERAAHDAAAKQQQHESELTECDQVVSNLAQELEQTMNENESLRRQLRDLAR